MRRNKINSIMIAAALALSMGITGCGGASRPADSGAATEITKVTESKTEPDSAAVIDSEIAAEEEEITESEEKSKTGAAAQSQHSNQSKQKFQDNFSVDDQSVTDFAGQIKSAIAGKDKDGLAKLLSFPVYIGLPDEKGGEIKTVEDYMALSDDDIFSDAMLTSIKDAADTGLSASRAGFTLTGESESQKLPSITFGVVNGELKIVGMNY